jgi:hypothetical protein
MLSRRGFLGGLASVFAAPAIVHAGNLMPVKALDPILFSQNPWWNPAAPWNEELAAVIRAAFVPRLFVQLEQVNPLMGALLSRQQLALTKFPVDGHVRAWPNRALDGGGGSTDRTAPSTTRCERPGHPHGPCYPGVRCRM